MIYHLTVLLHDLQAVGAAVFPSLIYAGPAQIDHRHRSAAANLAQARAEAREFGQERREEIRRRVQGVKEKEKDARNTRDAGALGVSDSESENPDK